MKISERIERGVQGINTQDILVIKQLESDSQMLEDLIEMLDEGRTYINIDVRQSARETVAAAIKAWKKK